MKSFLPFIKASTAKNKALAMATVTKTWGSSPRPVGSNMIISEDLEMAGSVSGGCVEGAVLKAAKALFKQGGGSKLAFGVSNEEAWEVGLSCGGSIQVYLDHIFSENDLEIWTQLATLLDANKPCILITKLVDGANQHLLVLPDGQTIGQSDERLQKEALRAYRERKSQVIELEDQQYFAQVFPRRSQMLIIGAAHITADLVRLAKIYDFETVVIDPRGAFTNKTQFLESPDRLVEKYPEEVLDDYVLDAYTYAVILSHDPKIDDNALHILLKSDVGYIGALGSRKTHAKRVVRLQEAGFTDDEIARIQAPIGVNINAKKPGEIALSVMAEIIQTKNAFY